jgi:subtilase family serine protease
LIVQPVDEGARTRLAGNVSAYARPERDVGLVPASQPMDGLAFILKRSPAQERDLEQFLAAQQDPASGRYHRWLTPEQFASRFGASEADIRTLSLWLKSHGFVVKSVARGRDLLRFSGTEAQVEAAFHTPIHYFVVSGERHWANVSDPQIPSAYAPAVAGILGLNDFRLRPQHHRAATGGNGLRPQFNAGAKGHAVAPADFATIYNVTPLWNKGITGAGATVAIAAQSNINLATPRAFWSAFGAAKNQTVTVTVPADASDPGEKADADETEADLDVEAAGAIAQDAHLILIPSSLGAGDSAEYAIDNNLAPILSISFGACELALTTAGNTAIAALFQKAAALGITVVVATGDSGSASCDVGDTTGPAPAMSGVAVSGVASTPYNTAVGGTDFTVFGAAVAQYWGGANAPGTFSDALSYMPEMPWNDSCANPLLLQLFPAYASNEAFCNDSGKAFSVVVAGGGGGTSNCTAPSGMTPATCAGGYAQPAWQSGVIGLPQSGHRVIPDVSLFAANGAFGNSWIICDYVNTTCDPNGSAAAADGYELIGGTSAAAPAFAGVVALLLQTQVTAASPDGRQGLINPTLYQLAGAEFGTTQAPNTTQLNRCNSSNGNAVGNTCIFYDVTTGGNAQPCTTGSPDCVTQTGGDAYGVLSSGGTAAYTTNAGFDLATGLGSLNVTNFVTALWIAPAPTGLTATPGEGTVALKWSASSRAQSYNVYEGTAAGGESAAPVLTGVSGTSATVAALTYGQKYFYRVAAVNGGGTSASSNEASATVLPSIPSALVAAAGNGSVTLSWTASTGATSYNIYQGTTSGAESASPVQTGITGATASVHGLSNGQAYFFEVAAVNAGGTSMKSSEASATPQAPSSGGGGSVGGLELLVLGLVGTWVRLARSGGVAAPGRSGSIRHPAGSP